MTTSFDWTKVRRQFLPLAWGLVVFVCVILFRADLVDWFVGHRQPTESSSGGHERGSTTPTNQAEPSTAQHAYSQAARERLSEALSAYEAVRTALAADRLDGVGDGGKAIAVALRAAKDADPTLPPELADRLSQGAQGGDALGRAAGLEGARVAFAHVSENLVAAVMADPTLSAKLFLFECPMTDGYKRWIQPEDGLSNPYMGTDMLTCGSSVDFDSLPAPETHAHQGNPDDIAHYTCPMDTWVRKKDPGACPVCSMDLVPVTHEEIRTGVMRIDHRRRQLIGLKTGLVEKRNLTVGVRAVGRVSYDESRLADVVLKFDGFIKKLHVNTTGQRVRKGQPLFSLYSPELYTAQQEFLLAASQHKTAIDDAAKKRSEGLVNGARQRLRLWDVTEAQLDHIAKAGKPLQYLPILAPASGYVVAKDVVEGASVSSGQRLFRIAALDKVWVEADLYEQDLPLIKLGQKALVTLTHLPGRTFEGKVSFLYPYLDGESRTSRARIELANQDLDLKPDMYANVELRVPLGEKLVVPESAIIYSGPRRVVFLDLDREKLQPISVKVGVKSDGFFEVVQGLKEGDRVVTSGNFLLSAESRLKAATGLW